MKRIRTRLVAIALLFTATSVSAEKWPAYVEPKTYTQVSAWSAKIGLRSSFNKCIDVAAAVVPDTRECIASEYQYQDKRLNTVYKKLVASLNPGDQSKLRDEERHWIAYRDGRCHKLEPQLEPENCELNATADRSAELEARLVKQ
jgi:uncharacterized protein YecT (DUF1311 family)